MGKLFARGKQESALSRCSPEFELGMGSLILGGRHPARCIYSLATLFLSTLGRGPCWPVGCRHGAK